MNIRLILHVLAGILYFATVLAAAVTCFYMGWEMPPAGTAQEFFLSFSLVYLAPIAISVVGFMLWVQWIAKILSRWSKV
jgi:hypothetical protein